MVGGRCPDDRILLQGAAIQFSIRGDQVRGIHCTHCGDATTLAFVDGRFGAAGITFVVTLVKADGSTAYQDQATARFGP